MMHVTDMSGLAGVAFATAALAVQLPGVQRLQRPLLAGLAALIAVAMLIPFGGLPLAAYVRGATGDLSITSLLLLAFALSRSLSGRGWLDAGNRMALLALVALAAVAFYPLALGFGLFDPYRPGYGSPMLLAALLALVLLAWRRQLPAIALTISLAVLAWGAGWYESPNLWDYLLDPLLAAYALAVMLKQGVRRLPFPRPR